MHLGLPAARENSPLALHVGLCATSLLSYCSYAMCRVPAIPLFASQLGASPATIGVVMAASTVTGVLLKLPAGALSDVVGRRRLLVAATLVYAVLPFAYLAVASVTLLVLVRAVHGSASAIFGPVASATLSDAAPAHRRGTWLGTYALFQGGGQAIGPVIAGYLISVHGFSAAFVTAGLIAAAAPLLSARLPVAKRPVARQDFVRGLREVWSNPLILLTSVVQAAQYLQHGALSAFLPLFAATRLGLSPSQLGLLFSVQIGTTLLVRPAMGALSDRIGRRVLIVCGLMLSSSAVVAIALTHTPGTLILAVAAYASGVALTTASTGAFITDLSHRARYGASHGLFGSIYDVGDALGPLIAGLLVTFASYELMFSAIGGSGLVAAGAFALSSRRARLQSSDSAKTSST